MCCSSADFLSPPRVIFSEATKLAGSYPNDDRLSVTRPRDLNRNDATSHERLVLMTGFQSVPV
jgi:hypothetical protein